jgi:hypothetical protein
MYALRAIEDYAPRGVKAGDFVAVYKARNPSDLFCKVDAETDPFSYEYRQMRVADSQVRESYGWWAMDNQDGWERWKGPWVPD